MLTARQSRGARRAHRRQQPGQARARRGLGRAAARAAPETGKAIVARIKSGQLWLVALHSAHWSSPFVEAMHERATQDVLKGLTDAQRKSTQLTFVRPKRFGAPKRNDPLTPSVKKQAFVSGFAAVARPR